MFIKGKIIETLARFQNDAIAESYPLDYCIPVYHTVSDDHLPHLKHLMQYKSEKEFEKDLDQISRNFQFVNWEEFKDFRQGKFQPKKKIALLTFDDGLSEFIEVVAPILERKGIYALNFINPKFIDNKAMMYRCKASLLMETILPLKEKEFDQISKKSFNSITKKELLKKIQTITFQEQMKIDIIAHAFDLNFKEYLQNKKPYLSLEQLKTLTAKGFGISNHGYDHPHYHLFTLQEQIENTKISLDFLKKNNFISESFAFPFTDFGVKKEFFDQIFTTENLFCTFGSAGLKLDDFEKNIQRVPMENGKDANQVLKEEIAYFGAKKRFNKNRIHRT